MDNSKSMSPNPYVRFRNQFSILIVPKYSLKSIASSQRELRPKFATNLFLWMDIFFVLPRRVQRASWSFELFCACERASILSALKDWSRNNCHFLGHRDIKACVYCCKNCIHRNVAVSVVSWFSNSHTFSMIACDFNRRKWLLEVSCVRVLYLLVCIAVRLQLIRMIQKQCWSGW